jgi:hypothetical protein
MANGSCWEPRFRSVVVGRAIEVVVVVVVGAVVVVVSGAGGVVVVVVEVVVVDVVVDVVVATFAIRRFATDFFGFVAADAGNARSVAATTAERNRFIGVHNGDAVKRIFTIGERRLGSVGPEASILMNSS